MSRTPALPRLYCFDFDGTLTDSDSLLAFIAFSRGRWRLLASFALFAPLLVLMKMGWVDNGRLKQRLFAFHFRGMALSHFQDLCRRFAVHYRPHLRPEGMQALRQAAGGGHRALVVSASIDLWVRACIATPGVTVVGTQVDTDAHGRLTGRFLTPNCYGAEKVRRVEQAVAAPLSRFHLVAYGDSRGDRELLAAAQEAWYKPFRQSERAK